MRGISHIGVDYGSKFAGTTALCFKDAEGYHLYQSGKGEDADQFLGDWLERLKPGHVFIDAPLSLPSAFYGKGNDFFYRASDREAGAMSPMFLGGLTARAMKMVKSYSGKETLFVETYPKLVLREVAGFLESYKKETGEIPGILSEIEKKLNYQVPSEILNWHQLDAFLCWAGGMRYFEGSAIFLGDPEEGQIIF